MKDILLIFILVLIYLVHILIFFSLVSWELAFILSFLIILSAIFVFSIGHKIILWALSAKILSGAENIHFFQVLSHQTSLHSIRLPDVYVTRFRHDRIMCWLSSWTGNEILLIDEHFLKEKNPLLIEENLKVYFQKRIEKQSFTKTLVLGFMCVYLEFMFLIPKVLSFKNKTLIRSMSFFLVYLSNPISCLFLWILNEKDKILEFMNPLRRFAHFQEDVSLNNIKQELLEELLS